MAEPLHQDTIKIREIIEILANIEGFESKTGLEHYLLYILKEIEGIAVRADEIEGK